MPDQSYDHADSDAVSADVLRALGVNPVSVAHSERIHAGLSGARLTRLVLAQMAGSTAPVQYCRRVIKQIAPSTGWLSEAGRDTQVREVRLWSREVLQRLPRCVTTAVCASYQVTSADGVPADGALLLRDERCHLWPEPFQAPHGRLPHAAATLLDRLAQVHARYWNDARLHDPTLGLMPTAASLLLLAPDTVRSRLQQGDPEPYLRLAAAGWDAFWRIAAPEDSVWLQQVLQSPEAVVAAIESMPFTLVHGDVWGPNLGWVPAGRRAPRPGRRLLLLDWALASAAPASFDVLWLCENWYTLSPVTVLAAYRARLTRHLASRGVHVAPQTWRALADAGYLRTVLTCGEALGRIAADARPGAQRARAEARLRWWANRAARAAHNLAPDAATGSAQVQDPQTAANWLTAMPELEHR